MPYWNQDIEECGHVLGGGTVIDLECGTLSVWSLDMLRLLCANIRSDGEKSHLGDLAFTCRRFWNVTRKSYLIRVELSDWEIIDASLRTRVGNTYGGVILAKISSAKDIRRLEKQKHMAGVVSFRFDTDFNRVVPKLPHTCEHLTFGLYFNKPVDTLPAGLRTLSVCRFFNQRVDSLPSKLRKLVVGGDFNQPVDRLPATLEVLILGWEFNHPVDRLPAGLKQLSLNGKFDHPLDSLPAGLETLKVASKFNRPIDKLPATLRVLRIHGCTFNRSLNHLPPGLRVLEFYGADSREDLSHLPMGLQTLVLGHKFHHDLKLPPTLKCLHVSDYHQARHYLHVLPRTITELVIGELRLKFE